MNEVLISKSAKKELGCLSPDLRQQVAEKIRLLAQTARPPGFKKLRGSSGYRLRSGDFRILYTINGSTITVHAVGNRKDVYRSRN
ncbi:MAG: type II toxin-antitoxin system RelE/ParE family toxin [Verrucomicrobia bacterium]|nr:type II toxin-antitoxin system RelE/ParE family toxin [Verrucomicrobiota bacterium]